MACLTNAIVFADMVAEIGGLGALPNGHLTPLPSDAQPPLYIPQINHGASRTAPLREPWVSIPLYELIGRDRNGRCRVLFDSPDALRRRFRLADDARFIISSVAPDHYIESFWADHRSRNLLAALASLEPAAMTVPNYSFMLDVPRTNTLYNFGRMFRMAERMTAAGIPTILHLNALTPFDWNQWLSVLRDQSQARHVALEFQTGAKSKEFRDRYFSRLVDLQERLGRGLHPIVLAGAGKLEPLKNSFTTFTVIDSTPFIKTMKRQSLRQYGGKWKWHFDPTPVGASLHGRLAQNISMHRTRLHRIVDLDAAGNVLQRLLFTAL